MFITLGLALLLQGRDGPPATFLTDVPASPLNVIEGAPTRTSMVLSLLSAETTKVDLVYQRLGRPALNEKAELTAGKPAEITLSNLSPSSEYTYIATSGRHEVKGKFHTARNPGESFKFDIQADSHLDGNSGLDVYQRTLENMVKDHPDFLVDLGDTFMVDKYPNYQDSLRQYQAQRYWFSIPGSQMPVFLCLGNHDGEMGWRSRGGVSTTEWSQQQRQTYFPAIHSDSFYSGAPKRGLYYSWGWGDAQFIVLDPFVATTQKARTDDDGWNWTLGADQFRWFETTLKNSTKKYKFVFIHHLVGGFGKDARGGVEAADKFEWGDTKYFPDHRAGWAEPIHSLMVKYGVTALFHGHDHLYVRQERDGILYMEVPQPSHARGENTTSAKEYGYTSGTLLGSSGHIRVSVDPNTVKIEYVKSLSGSRNCEVADHTTIPSKK